ncbi:hypothetical protein Pfo_000972 [Paulownia fortunei]|nr:hypothetical protein Pfo_000972 [Paulownia fortunei]
MASEVLHQLEPWSRLDGKIVMVTGASSALAGCRIVAAARRMDRLISLCDEINKFDRLGGNGDGCRAVAVELDIASDGGAIEASVAKAWDAFGHIDALINNAGVRGQVRSSLDISEEEWNQVLKTNLLGTWQVSKCVISRLRAAGRGGSIINISSVGGLNRVQYSGGIAYNSSKSGMDSITRTMALELGKYNVRVNAKIIPLRTCGSTDPALTSIIRYLIHDSSGYISGNIFIVDGGVTLPGFPIYSSL